MNTAPATTRARSAFDLSGKVAVVTGSTRGIGRSIAEHLAAAGARVVISSRNAQACEDVAQSIRQDGGQAIAVAANISQRAALELLVQRTNEHWGQIDIMVANAATNPHYGPMLGVSDEAFDKIMHNNVLSTMWLAHMVLPAMAERRDGVVIIISSVGGLKGHLTLGAYCLSKAAEMQLARNLAVEWGPHNVRVNCIAPGLIKTDFARAIWEDPKVLAFREQGTPLRRMGEPDDIGGIAVLLAGRAGAYITGQVIAADGGVSIA